MALPSFPLPEPVRLKALALGEEGLRWMAELSTFVRALEQQWQLRVGAPLPGGSASLILPAVRVDDTLAVLKIGIPESGLLTSQAQVLRLANGRGYAKLLEHEETRNAILVERLGPPLAHQGLCVQAQIEMICASLQVAWVPLEAANGLMTGADKAKALAQFIAETWSALDAPCAKATKDRALAFAEEREAAHDPLCCVLVQGDAHAFNTLQQLDEAAPGGTTYKFIDPDGLFAEPAYDLAIPMREWSSDLLAGDVLRRGQERCAQLSALTGVDHRAIWQWGFIERVSTGLFLLKVGMTALGSAYLAVADRWSTAGTSHEI